MLINFWWTLLYNILYFRSNSDEECQGRGRPVAEGEFEESVLSFQHNLRLGKRRNEVSEQKWYEGWKSCCVDDETSRLLEDLCKFIHCHHCSAETWITSYYSWQFCECDWDELDFFSSSDQFADFWHPSLYDFPYFSKELTTMSWVLVWIIHNSNRDWHVCTTSLMIIQSHLSYQQKETLP